jgi:hypothetical protein
MTNTTDSDRIGAAIRAAAESVEAPPELRRQVTSPEKGERRSPARRWIALPALGLLAAAVVTAIALFAIGSGGGPTIADAAGLALRAPDQPAPAGDRHDERFLRADVEGVRFPNYRYSTPFHTSGARTDELTGRRTRTVVYGLGNKRIGYTIVAGKPLPVPSGARRLTRDGLRLAAFRSHGALVVTWRQGGHTCVLASRDATLERLVDWAAWT